jgi:hypothetical protein
MLEGARGRGGDTPVSGFTQPTWNLGARSSAEWSGFGLFRAVLAGCFDTLQLLVGLEVGTFQAALDLGQTVEDRDASFGGQARGEAIGFQDFHAHQLPLGDGGLVNEVLLGLVLGLVEAFEAVVPGRMILLARRPWRSEFMEEVAFPWGVFGQDRYPRPTRM